MINRGIYRHGVLTWILDHDDAVMDCAQIVITASPARLLVNANVGYCKRGCLQYQRLGAAERVIGRDGNQSRAWSPAHPATGGGGKQRRRQTRRRSIRAQTHPRQKKKPNFKCLRCAFEAKPTTRPPAQATRYLAAVSRPRPRCSPTAQHAAHPWLSLRQPDHRTWRA